MKNKIFKEVHEKIIKIFKEVYEKIIKRLNDLENEKILESQKKWDALMEESIKKAILKKENNSDINFEINTEKEGNLSV